MRRFNPERELRKIQHGNKNKLIFGVMALLLILTIGSTYALYQVRYSKRIIYTKVAPFSTKDLDLAVYVNGIKQSGLPDKNNEYKYATIDCDDGVPIAEWDENNWNFKQILNINVPNKCDVYFVDESSTSVQEFSYTGAVQEYEIPQNGIYKLEVWGAQGGAGAGYAGGFGGYSSGNIELDFGEKLYIYVGGAGLTANTGACCVGGFNGGGSACARTYLSVSYSSGSGGGATHIATKEGLLKDLEDYKNDILIVAGGGGGGSYDSGTVAYCCIGGSGGGLSGDDTIGGNAPSKGGTQTEAGAGGGFGYGGNSSTSLPNSGGGGGYFGGGTASYHQSCGGGGSGYINSAFLKADTENGMNSGNGKARIIYLGPKVNN